MADSKLLLSTLWYSFLYGLVIVPLGFFLGAITCVGGISGSAGQFGPFAYLGMLVDAGIVGGSFYLSYKLGRNKARAKAMDLTPKSADGKIPGGEA